MSRYELLNKDIFPNEFYGFVDPDDYYSYNGIITSDGGIRQYKSLDELCNHIASRRESVSLPPLNHIPEMVQQYLYILGEAPRDFFIKVDDRTFLSDVQKGASIAVSLSRAAFEGVFTAGSFGWVTKSKANKRASICVHCPHNKATRKSVTTKLNDKVAALFTLTRTSDYDSKLKDCEVCGCPLPIKIHYSDDIIFNNTEQSVEDFPELVQLPNRAKGTCWVRDILKEHATEES